MATVAAPPESRLYPKLVKHEPREEPPKIPQRRVYWSRYSSLRTLKKVGNRRVISFLFFSFMFVFTTAEFTGNIKFGRGITTLQVFVALFSTGSVLMSNYGIENCNYSMLVPLMSITMGALSCYICLFGVATAAILQSPPFQFLLLGYNCFVFGVTTTVTFILARATDILWQAFFTLVDLNQHRELMEKLRTNGLMSEDLGKKQNVNKNKKKKQGARSFLVTGRRAL